MAAFYAIYHGPEGLRRKANHAHQHTLVLAEGLKQANNQVLNEQFFDTIKVKPTLSIGEIRKKAEAKQINLRYYEDNKHVTPRYILFIFVFFSTETFFNINLTQVGISLDDTVTSNDITDLLEIFDSKETFVKKILTKMAC